MGISWHWCNLCLHGKFSSYRCIYVYCIHAIYLAVLNFRPISIRARSNLIYRKTLTSLNAFSTRIVHELKTAQLRRITLQNSPERDWICIQIPSPVIRRKGPESFASPFLDPILSLCLCLPLSLFLVLSSFVELRHKEHLAIVLYDVSLSFPFYLSSSHLLCIPFSSFLCLRLTN